MNRQDNLFVGVIPDGNRRWAEQNGRACSAEGHQAGAERLKKIFERARDMQVIKIMTAWGLSCSNLKGRSRDELEGLFTLMDDTLTDLRDNWIDRDENRHVRMVHLGRQDNLQKDPCGKHVLERLNEISERTREREGMIIGLCIDYDGRDEANRAVDAYKASANGKAEWTSHLDLPTQGVPYQTADLVLRTGVKEGASAYDNEYLYGYKAETRLRCIDTLFPDLKPQDFESEVMKFMAETQRRGA